ncbi:hypothetical protein ABPG74_009835 [Tetrahymena malaccensis]
MVLQLKKRQNNQKKNSFLLKKKIQIPYYLEPCTLDHFINLPSYQFNWTESFYKQNISNFLCLQKNQKFYIGGIYENEDFQFIKFSISKCVNSTLNPTIPWNPICEQPDIIKASQNQGSRIRFLISNNILNPEKATGSITSFLDSQIFNVQQSLMYTTANVYLNEQTIVTDESIFPIESSHTESLIQFQRSDIQQQNSVGNFGVFCEIFFARSNFSTLAKKSYLKLNQVISYIGGFCQIFFLVSCFLVNKFNTYIFYNELANRLYDFEIKDYDQNNPQYKLDKRRDTLINKDILNTQTRNNTIEQTPLNYNKNNRNSIIGSPLKPIKEGNQIIPIQIEKSDKKQNLSFKNYLSQQDNNSSRKENSVLNSMFNNNRNNINKFKLKDENSSPLKIQDDKNEIQKIDLNQQQDIKEVNELDQQKANNYKTSISYLDHDVSVLNDNKNTTPLIQIKKEDQIEQPISINQFQLNESSNKKDLKVDQLDFQNNQVIDQEQFEHKQSKLIKMNKLSNSQSIWDNLNNIKQNTFSDQNTNQFNLQIAEVNNSCNEENININNLNSQENQNKNTILNQKDTSNIFQNKQIQNLNNKQSQLDLQNLMNMKDNLNQNLLDNQGQNKVQWPNLGGAKRDLQLNNNDLDNKHQYLRQNQNKNLKNYICDDKKTSIKMLTQIRQPNQFLENELKSIIDRNRSLYVNFKYIVNQITCGKIFNTPDVQLLNKAYDLVSEDLDIFTILDRQLQLNKIKNLIFNGDQQVLFNFFPKPIIKLNKEEELLNLKQIKEEEQQQSRNLAKVKRRQRKLNIGLKEHGIFAKAVFKFRKQPDKMTAYQKLYSHYSKLAKQCQDDNSQSSINKKLIEHLGDEMRNIFEVADFMQKKQAQRVSQLNQLNQQNEQSPYNQVQEILQVQDKTIQNLEQNPNKIADKEQEVNNNQVNNQEIKQEFHFLNQQTNENTIQLIVIEDEIDQEIQS